MSRVRFLMMGLLCLATACKPSEPAKEAEEAPPSQTTDFFERGVAKKAEVYKSPVGFSIEIPAGWSYAKYKTGSPVMAGAPDEQASFRVWEVKSVGKTLDSAFAGFVEEAGGEFHDFKVIANPENLKVGDLPAKRVLVTATEQGENIKGFLYMAGESERFFCFMFAADEENFDEATPIFDRILKSFKVTK